MRLLYTIKCPLWERKCFLLLKWHPSSIYRACIESTIYAGRNSTMGWKPTAMERLRDWRERDRLGLGHWISAIVLLAWPNIMGFIVFSCNLIWSFSCEIREGMLIETLLIGWGLGAIPFWDAGFLSWLNCLWSLHRNRAWFWRIAASVLSAGFMTVSCCFVNYVTLTIPSLLYHEN